MKARALAAAWTFGVALTAPAVSTGADETGRQATPAAFVSDRRAGDERAIRAEMTAWFEAGAAKDGEKFGSYYAPDASLFPPNEPIVNGKAAIQAYWREFFKRPGLVFGGGTTHVEASKAGDLAYEHGTYEVKLGGPDGKPVTSKGKYVVVWKKQPDGKWKAVADIFNANQ